MRHRNQEPCPATGYPRFGSATDAWKAGTKIIRHPLDTEIKVDKCDFCRKYHYIVKDRRDGHDRD